MSNREKELEPYYTPAQPLPVGVKTSSDQIEGRIGIAAQQSQESMLSAQRAANAAAESQCASEDAAQRAEAALSAIQSLEAAAVSAAILLARVAASPPAAPAALAPAAPAAPATVPGAELQSVRVSLFCASMALLSGAVASIIEFNAGKNVTKIVLFIVIANSAAQACFDFLPSTYKKKALWSAAARVTIAIGAFITFLYSK